MNSESNDVDLEQLSAYLDDELEEAAAKGFEEHLESNPDARRLLADYQRQDDSLRAALNATLDEPVPARFDRLLNRPVRTTEAQSVPDGVPFWRGRLATAIASGALCLAVGIFAGWNVRSNMYSMEAERMALDLFLQKATNSYSMFAGGEFSWGASGLRTDRNEFAEWFKKALNIDISTPDFSDRSFAFVGGRALPVSSRGTAGQILYENADGQVVAIYFQVDPSAPPSTQRLRRNGNAQRNGEGSGPKATFVEREELSVYYWRSMSGSTSYAMIGAIDKDGLGELANAILEHFSN